MRTLIGQRVVRTLVAAAFAAGAASGATGCAGAASPSVAGGARDAQGGPVVLGSPAPELETVPVRGHGPQSLAEARGKVVLVDLWATFCKPCKRLLPKYQRLAEQLDGKLVVIAVSVDDPDDTDARRIDGYVDDLGLSFRVVWDRSQRTVARYDPPHMPTSYLIDSDGVLRKIYPGAANTDIDQIRRDVEALLAQQGSEH